MSAETQILFSETDLRDLLAKINLPIQSEDQKDAASTIDEYLRRFVLTHLWEQQPAPSGSAAKLEKIRFKAAQLRQKLPTPKKNDFDIGPKNDTFNRLASSASFLAEELGGYPHLITPVGSGGNELPYYRGADVLEAAIAYVSLIEKWADNAANRAKNQVRPGKRTRHKGNRAVRELIGDVYGFWINYAGARPPNWAETTGTSPFIQFILLIRDHLMGRLPAANLEIDPVLKKTLEGLTANKLRLRIQRDLNFAKTQAVEKWLEAFYFVGPPNPNQ